MKKIIIYVFLFIIVAFIFLFVDFVNDYFSERVEVYIEDRGIIYTQQFIQKAIMENVINDIEISEMYLMKEDTNQNVENISINTANINKVLGLVNKSIGDNILLLENEEISIPLSTILGDTIFSKYGPHISLQIVPIGNFKCDIISEVTEYGINNSLFEIYIQIKMKIESIVPLKRIESEVECKIPLIMQIIQGDVPRYYYNTDKLVPDVYDNF